MSRKLILSISFLSLGSLLSLFGQGVFDAPDAPTETLSWDLARFESETGTTWVTARFETEPGAVYTLQSSPNLKFESWSAIQSFYAVADELHLALFEAHPPEPEPASSSSGDGEPPAEGSEAFATVSFQLRPIADQAATLVTWTSIDPATAEQEMTQIIPSTLDPAWLTQPFHLKQFERFFFFLGAMPSFPQSDPFTESVFLPDSPDQEAFALLAANFTLIQQNVIATQSDAADAPVALPPHPGSKRFYRLARTYPDSDGDGISDRDEIAFGLGNPFDADSDNNGIDDGAEDSDNDGSTDAEEFANGTDPDDPSSGNAADFGLINSSFSQPIDGEAVIAFDVNIAGLDEANLYSESQIEGWSAVEEGLIEIHQIEGQNFAELQAHGSSEDEPEPVARGIQQEFKMLPDSTLNYLVWTVGRVNGSGSGDNDYEIEIEGATFELEEDSSPSLPDESKFTTLKIIAEPNEANPAAAIDVTIKITNEGSNTIGTRIALLPVELLMDLDNDGNIGGADSGLRSVALESAAFDEDKEKGTEYLFYNDQLSNGLWDQDDPDPDKPENETEDDDAQEIKVIPGITDGEVWLEHPAIDGLSFYKTRDCKPADLVGLSPTNKFAVSSSNPFPEQLFVRADGAITFPAANPQVEGDLILKVKVDGANGQEIEVLRIKLNVIEKIGSPKYFHASKDYILENNTRFHVRDNRYDDDRFGWADSQIRVVSMRESATILFPIDAARRASGTPLRGIDTTANAFEGVTVAINGNISYFSNDTYNSTMSRITVPGAHNFITDKCHGRMVRFSTLDAAVSSDNDVSTTSPAGSDLAGPEGKYLLVDQNNQFELGKGRVPLEPIPKAALGGASTNYSHPDRDGKPYQMFGRCELEHQNEDNVIVFTATHRQPVGNGFVGKVAEFVQDAERSGVDMLPGGAVGDAELLLLDGGSSVALGYTDADENMTVHIKGGKHTGQLPFYYINTYLLFRCEKPR